MIDEEIWHPTDCKSICDNRKTKQFFLLFYARRHVTDMNGM